MEDNNQDNIGDDIIITHYIHPQNFWYFKVDYLINNAKKFFQMNIALQMQYDSMKTDKMFKSTSEIPRYNVGDLVMVKYQPVNRALRARILNVFTTDLCESNLPQKLRYIVWCTDYGFPLATDESLILPLPTELEDDFGIIQHGGLAYIAPINGKNWEQESLFLYEYIIKKAQRLTFNTAVTTAYNQNLGYLFISNTLGTCKLAVTFLFLLEQCKRSSAIFHKVNSCSWLNINDECIAELNEPNQVAHYSYREIHNLVFKQLNLSVSSETMPVNDLKNTEFYETDDLEKPIAQPIVNVEPINKIENTDVLKRDYPVNNCYTKLRSKIESLADPSTKIDKMNAIIKLFYDNENSNEQNDAQSNEVLIKSLNLEKLDKLLHKNNNIHKEQIVSSSVQMSENAEQSELIDFNMKTSKRQADNDNATSPTNTKPLLYEKSSVLMTTKSPAANVVMNAAKDGSVVQNKVVPAHQTILAPKIRMPIVESQTATNLHVKTADAFKIKIPLMESEAAINLKAKTIAKNIKTPLMESETAINLNAKTIAENIKPPLMGSEKAINLNAKTIAENIKPPLIGSKTAINLNARTIAENIKPPLMGSEKAINLNAKTIVENIKTPLMESEAAINLNAKTIAENIKTPLMESEAAINLKAETIARNIKTALMESETAINLNARTIAENIKPPLMGSEKAINLNAKTIAENIKTPLMESEAAINLNTKTVAENIKTALMESETAIKRNNVVQNKSAKMKAPLIESKETATNLHVKTVDTFKMKTPLMESETESVSKKSGTIRKSNKPKRITVPAPVEASKLEYHILTKSNDSALIPLVLPTTNELEGLKLSNAYAEKYCQSPEMIAAVHSDQNKQKYEKILNDAANNESNPFSSEEDQNGGKVIHTNLKKTSNNISYNNKCTNFDDKQKQNNVSLLERINPFKMLSSKNEATKINKQITMKTTEKINNNSEEITLENCMTTESTDSEKTLDNLPVTSSKLSFDLNKTDDKMSGLMPINTEQTLQTPTNLIESVKDLKNCINNAAVISDAVALDKTVSGNTDQCRVHIFDRVKQALSLNTYKINSYETNSTKLLDNESEKGLQTIFCEQLVLAHATVPIKPLQVDIYESRFAPTVLHVLGKLNNTKFVYRIQSYAWPHLMEGNSLFVINGPASGRTWCYLPALCTNVLNNMEARFRGLDVGFGPIAIILVSSIKQGEQTSSACWRLLIGHKTKLEPVVCAFNDDSNNSVRIKLHNGCGILIITINQLATLLEQNKIEQMILADNVKYLVIDDIDIILKSVKAKGIIYRLFKCCGIYRSQLTAADLSQNKNLPQLIVTSKYWNQDYFPTLIRLARNPLVLFGDFLEAAVYAGVNFEIKISTRETKVQQLIDYLSQQESIMHTIIICSNDQIIIKLCAALEMVNYKCLPYLSDANIHMRQQVRNWAKKESYELLIGTDKCLELIQAQNVKCIIHYNMANSWSKFKMSFAVIAANYPNYVATCHNKNKLKTKLASTKNILRAFLLLDEHNDKELPTLVAFLQQHNQSIPKLLKNIAGTRKFQMEKLRLANEFPLCTEAMIFGDCINEHCKYRHVILPNIDAANIKESRNLPNSGYINFVILKMYSPVHYAVRLLHHRKDFYTDIWRNLPQKSAYGRLALALNLYYGKPINHIQHWPPKAKDVCVAKICDVYQRVCIVDAPAEISTNIDTSLYVTVKTMDINTDVYGINVSELLSCPEHLKGQPALAINMILTGYVPNNNGRDWDSNVVKIINHEIEQYVTDNEQLQACIDFSMMHTIYVKNIVAVNHLPTLTANVSDLNIKTLLTQKNIAHYDKDIVQRIYKWANVVLVNSVSDNNDMQIQSKQTDGNLKEQYEEIYKPVDLHNKVLNTSVQINNTNAEQINENMDIFQTVAVATETWCSLPLNVLTCIDIGNAIENGRWDNFHIIPISKEHMTEFMKLNDLINDYMSEHKPRRITNFKTMQINDNFIHKHTDDAFVRAKLTRLYGSAEAPNLYRFLLLDYGYYITLKAEKMTEMLFYECPMELITACRYQTICCKLYGIKLYKNSQIYKVTGEQLYALALNEEQTDYGMKFYDILLYELNKADDNVSDGILINQQLIEMQLAYYDDETKCSLLKETIQNKSKLFESFIKCLSDNIDGIENENHDDDDTVIEFIGNLFGTEFVTKKQQKVEVEKLEKTNETTETIVNRVMPRLESIYKCPQVLWHQTTGIIYLSIQANDVSEYQISCDGNRLFYAAMNNEIQEVFHMHLCSLVQAIEHEKRGLNIMVKLYKSICAFWPSLLKTTAKAKTYKLPWLKYNLEHSKPATDALSHAQETVLILERLNTTDFNGYEYNEDYENSDNEQQDIVYTDDVFDTDTCRNEYPIC